MNNQKEVVITQRLKHAINTFESLTGLSKLQLNKRSQKSYWIHGEYHSVKAIKHDSVYLYELGTLKGQFIVLSLSFNFSKSAYSKLPIDEQTVELGISFEKKLNKDIQYSCKFYLEDAKNIFSTINSFLKTHGYLKESFVPFFEEAVFNFYEENKEEKIKEAKKLLNPVINKRNKTIADSIAADQVYAESKERVQQEIEKQPEFSELQDIEAQIKALQEKAKVKRTTLNNLKAQLNNQEGIDKKLQLVESMNWKLINLGDNFKLSAISVFKDVGLSQRNLNIFKEYFVNGKEELTNKK